MAGVGRLERRVVIAVEACEAKAVRFAADVLDPHPDRLNSPLGERHAEEPIAFAVVQHRQADYEIVVVADLGPLEKGAVIGPRLVGHPQPAPP